MLERHGVPFIPLPDVEWTVYQFQSPLLKLNAIFPEGIEIPKMYVGKNVVPPADRQGPRPLARPPARSRTRSAAS